MQAIDCRPCCAETQVTLVPGVEGPPGTGGISPPAPPPPQNGIGAYWSVANDFIIPAIGANVSVTFDSATPVIDDLLNETMAIGQVIVFDGPANFEVVALTGFTTGTFKFLGYANDLSPGATISTGAAASPGGTQPPLDQLSVIAAGTAYQLTATAALLDFGTTDPTLTITSPGTWLLLARGRFDYNAATFAANGTVTMKLRRTNNAPADLPNGAAVFPTDIITTLSYPAWDLQTPPVLYQTLNSNDTVSLFGDVSVVPSAGSLDCTAAQIIAIKLT